MNERIMPQNIDAEAAALGSVFLSRYAGQKVIEELKKEAFYTVAHQELFETIKDLMESATPIDATTVTAELTKNKKLSTVGGVEYLAEVINKVPTAANVDEYIKIINETYLRRRLIETATNIVTDGFSSTDAIGDLLDGAEKKLLDVVKDRRSTEFKKIKDVLYKAQSDLEELSKQKGEVTGIPTGYHDLDRLTKGFHENELINFFNQLII